ncbi:MAG: SUMF1/EgtB/PvdO family nonheme iron enzyme [Treponema sp.]|nr:SUMF1/EgtB/PvdO family nonheme iron enzyme [Treponema sp.]
MSDDNVRLKPILGIQPGVYLACLYGIILLIILFFILLYPGLRNPGSVIIVKTIPRGAAILVDGIYRGSSPNEVFAGRGRRQIELSLPGFESIFIEEDIGGRVFASRLFPSRVYIDESLKSPDPVAAFINEAFEFAEWSFAGEPGPAYQIPLSLSEGAYRLGPGAIDAGIGEVMDGILEAAARFTVTRAGLRDLIRAKTLIDNLGLSPSPISLLSSLDDIISYLNDNPSAALWLSELLSSESRSELMSSQWYASANFTETSFEPVISQPIRLGNLNFRLIGGGIQLPGKNFPPGSTVGSFYISETVVNSATWEAFLEQNPRWRAENKDNLVTLGLVNEDYLEEIAGTTTIGVSGISMHAATAFCEWFSREFLQGFEGWEMRLPTELEWEYAARAGIIDYGNFWEWTCDPFSHLSFLRAPQEAISALSSPEFSLRGGSWVNPQGSVDFSTRASLPGFFSSPFISFRPVIAGIQR